MGLSYLENYWDSPDLKAQFISFLDKIFGLDLSLWDRMGFWDHRYRPFSYFDNDGLVSNVCVYSMDMTVNGKRCPVAQISAVGTVPEYRRKGLGRELLQTALSWAMDKHVFCYLFADEEAYGLYRQNGFRPVDEFKIRTEVRGLTPRPGAEKLDMNRTDHVDLVYRLASNREPVSNLLGVLNEKLFMYWCLYALRDYIYNIPDHEVLVLYKRKNDLITVYDIVGSEIPSFSEVYPYMGNPTDRTAEFHFMTDRLNLEDAAFVKVEGNGTHIRGDFPLENSRFIMPLTSHA